jgi:SAM-dependent methyltransferase
MFYEFAGGWQERYSRSDVMSLAPLRQWFRARGLADSLRHLIADVRQRISPRQQRTHPFDRRHGLDTSGLLYADALATGHPHDLYSEGYYATAPSLFHGALAHWQANLHGLSLADYTFVDLGCGKGRVLMMASEYPFRAIAGVELSTKLATVARKNLARWMRTPRACSAVSVVEGDVLAFRIPEGPAVLFLFNSFEAEMMRGLLECLEDASRTRSAPIDLIYLHPEHDNLVMRTAGIERLADDNIPLSAEDAAADAFEVNVDQCCIYRINGRLMARSGHP